MAIINSAIAPLSSALTDSASEIQAVVDAYAAVISAADGLANGGAKLTTMEFQTLGLIAIDSVESTSLLNSAIDALPLAAVDTQPELVALGNTVAGIILTANGGDADPSLTPQALAALGITGVTASNLAYVLEAYVAAGAAGLTTMTDLQAITSAAAAAALAAGLNVISVYDGTNAEPTIADFANAEVIGVTAVNLAAVNSVLAIVSAGDSDTTVEIQMIVGAMQKVIVGADGLANGSSLLTAADFASLGLALIDTSSKVNLMNELIDTSTFGQVDTYGELAAIADIVAAIIATSVGSTPAVALTVASFASIGITGINETNLALMVAAIEASPDDTSGVNTLARIQAIATRVVDAQNAALVMISQYDGTNTEPLLTTFSDLGVVGVDVQNIAGINDYLAAMGVSLTDSFVEIQDLIDAYNALAPGVDALDNDNVNLSLAQWHALGYTDLTTEEEVVALNDFFDTEDWLVSGSASITRSIVDDIIALLAPAPAPVPVPRAGVGAGAGAGAGADAGGASSTNPPVSVPIVPPNVGTDGVVTPTRPANNQPQRPSRPNGNVANSLVNEVVTASTTRPGESTGPLFSNAPLPGSGIREVTPGQVAAVVGGRVVEATVISISPTVAQLQFPGGIEVSLRANSPTFYATSSGSGGARLQVMRAGVVTIEVTGFAPVSLIDVAIFSDPTNLGVVETDSTGSFTGELGIPSSVVAGPHTIKLDGLTPDGLLMTVSIGVEVLDQRFVDGTEAGAGVSASGAEGQGAQTPLGVSGQLLLTLLLMLLMLGTTAAWFIARSKRRRADSLNL